MSTTELINLPLVEWQSSLATDLQKRRDAIVAEHGEALYDRALQRALALDEEATKSYREWEAAVEESRNALPHPSRGDEWLEAVETAGRAVFQGVTDPRNRTRVRERIDAEIGDLREAVEVFGNVREQFGILFGDPDEAIGEFMGRSTELRGNLRDTLAGLSDFASFWGEAEAAIRRVRENDPEAPALPAIMRDTTLGQSFGALVKDEMSLLEAQTQLGFGEEAGGDYLYSKILRNSTPLDRRKIERNPQGYRDLAKARWAYLTLASDIDGLARKVVETGKVESFGQARETLIGELDQAWRRLKVAHDQLPKLKGDPLFMPMRPQRAREVAPTPFHGPAVLLRDALRAMEEWTRGLRTGEAPETRLERRAFVQAISPVPGDPEERRFHGIFPGNPTAATQDLLKLGFLLPGFVLAEALVGAPVAAGIGRLAQGLGPVARGALTGAARTSAGLAAAEATSPEFETAEERLRATVGGAVGGAVLGAAGGAVGGLVARRAGTRAAVKAIERPKPVEAPEAPIYEIPTLSSIGPEKISQAAVDAAKTAVERQITAAAPVVEMTPLNQKIIKAIGAVDPDRRAQDLLYRAERGKRIPRVMKIWRENPTERGASLAVREMGGELPKVDFKPIRDQFTKEEIDFFYRELIESDVVSSFEKMAGKNGLDGLFGVEGVRLPAPSQLDILSRVFGKDFAEAIVSKRGVNSAVHEISEWTGLSRALVASADISATTRQGGILMWRNPKAWGRAYRDQFKFLASEKNIENLRREVVANSYYDDLRKGGLAMTALESGYKLTSVEEKFISRNLIERLAIEPVFGAGLQKAPARVAARAVRPIVAASDRAYSGFLTKFRVDVATDLIRKFEASGLINKTTNPELYQEQVRQISHFVNAFTGRSTLEGMGPAVDVLATAFFSPRFQASRLRILNPMTYVPNSVTRRAAPSEAVARLASPYDENVAKEALASAVASTSAGLTILSLAAFAGFEVGLDWRSADFGKIKIGKSRTDIWQGLTQYPRTLAILISGQYKSSVTGRVRKLGEPGGRTRKDVAYQFIENREAPIPHFVTRMLEGKDYDGKPIKISTEVQRLYTPIIVDDIRDIAVTDPSLLPLAFIALHGTGVQTYPVPK
jgi:hypothetical protein